MREVRHKLVYTPDFLSETRQQAKLINDNKSQSSDYLWEGGDGWQRTPREILGERNVQYLDLHYVSSAQTGKNSSVCTLMIC